MVGHCHPNSKRYVFFPIAYYRLISITSALSKVFERLVSVGNVRFMERSDVLPTTQFAGKVEVPMMQFCTCPV